MSARIDMIVLLAIAGTGCAGGHLQARSPSAGPEGVSIAALDIDSSPSTACVYIDGKYVGNTPLVHGIAYDSNTRYIEVVAEPLSYHPLQQRQTKHIRVPPLPARLHFFMNNHGKPEDDG